MSEVIRPLTPQETCAMYHYHSEYAALGIGAIAYYKGLSPRDKSFIDDMTAAILKAAQQSVQSDGATFCDCTPPLGDVNPDNRCGIYLLSSANSAATLLPRLGDKND